MAIKINAAAEEKAPASILNYFKKMVKMRKESLELVYGKYTLLDKDNPDVYAYTRELNGKKLLILLNFKSKTASVKTGINFINAKILLGNYSAPSLDGKLRPYEAVVYEF